MTNKIFKTFSEKIKAKSIDKKKIYVSLVIFTLIFYKLISTLIIEFTDSKLEVENSKSINSEFVDNKNGEEFELSKDSKAKKADDTKRISVYISGAVSNPSVVSIDSDMRLDKAIEKVGGLTKDADVERINLAMKLEDGQHYIIPYKGQKNIDDANLKVSDSTGNTMDKSSGGMGSDSKKININTASKEELDSIPGVGPSTADKILDYRKEKGKFKSIEELKNVSGIGDKKFEKMKNNIAVD